MGLDLYLSSPTPAALRAFLDGHLSQGTLLLPSPEGEQAVEQFAQLALHISLPGSVLPLQGEVLQLMPDGGLVLRLNAAENLDALVEGTQAEADAAPPKISWSAPAAAEEKRGAVLPAGMGPVSWPIEKLQQEWKGLSIPDKINVAKRGNLAARRMILKLHDRKLQQYVLANAGITAEEIAAMASMTGLEPDLLKRIAAKPEWLRHRTVVRNLICNPKLPLDVVTRILGRLPDMELRKLTKSGRVRDAVKRIIIKKVSG